MYFHTKVIKLRILDLQKRDRSLQIFFQFSQNLTEISGFPLGVFSCGNLICKVQVWKAISWKWVQG